MYRRLTILLLLLLLLPVSGCLTKKQVYKDPPDPKGNDAMVFFYRSDSDSNSGIDSLYYINDVNVARLKRNRHTWLHVPAGKYVLKHAWAGTKQDVLSTSVNWRPGGVYFYRLGTSNLNGVVSWYISARRHNDIMTQIRDSGYMPSFGVEKLKK